jgi:predicted HTH domain antitoxin
MEYKQHISKTDLARNTHNAIREAQRGYTVVVESHGRAEVAIVDILDFQIQRAAIQYLTNPQKFNKDIEITEAGLQTLPDDQTRYNLVVGHYLAVHLSLGRAAELLRMPLDELRSRLVRCGVPLKIGPANMDEFKDEIDTIENL